MGLLEPTHLMREACSFVMGVQRPCCSPAQPCHVVTVIILIAAAGPASRQLPLPCIAEHQHAIVSGFGEAVGWYVV